MNDTTTETRAAYADAVLALLFRDDLSPTLLVDAIARHAIQAGLARVNIEAGAAAGVTAPRWVPPAAFVTIGPIAEEQVSNFCTVPAGTYVCRVAEVRTGQTRSGDERWALRLDVDDGEHKGTMATWDSLVFSNRGRARARMVFLAFGFDTKGTLRLCPDDLIGRRCLVEVRPVEYPSPTGELIRRNEVPYDGYRSLPS